MLSGRCARILTGHGEWSAERAALPAPGTFTELLPLLRRTVSAFTAPERRELGERAAHGDGPASGAAQTGTAIDPAWARRVLPILHTLLEAQVPEEAIDGK